jgi:hypothetical protein
MFKNTDLSLKQKRANKGQRKKTKEKETLVFVEITMAALQLQGVLPAKPAEFVRQPQPILRVKNFLA